MVEGTKFRERMSPVSFSSHEILKHKHIQTEKAVIARQAVTAFFVYLNERRKHMNVITK